MNGTARPAGAAMDTAAAEAFEQYLVPTIFGPWSEMLVDHALLKCGESVLDIGCGSGPAARYAATLVGDGGSVRAIDVDPGMIALARRLDTSGTVDWLEGDVSDMPFDANSFDAVIGGQIYQFLPDRPAAFREIHRVLKPGGRLVLNVFSRLELCPGHNAVAKALESHDVDPTGIRKPYSFGDPVVLGDVIADGGFRDVSVIRKTLEARFDSPAAFVEALATGGPSARHALEQLDEEALKQVIAEVTETLAKYVDDEGVRILTTANFVYGRRG